MSFNFFDIVLRIIAVILIILMIIYIIVALLLYLEVALVGTFLEVFLIGGITWGHGTALLMVATMAIGAAIADPELFARVASTITDGASSVASAAFDIVSGVVAGAVKGSNILLYGGLALVGYLYFTKKNDDSAGEATNDQGSQSTNRYAVGG